MAVREAMDARQNSGQGEDATFSVTLGVLSQKLRDIREAAVRYRKQSGIEDVWLECEEAYLGIDDENRHEFLGARWAKPTVMAGPLTSNDGRKNSSNAIRSTAFVRLTSRYVDAGSAKLSEILLPIDDKAFSLDATPLPDLIEWVDNKKQVIHPELGPLMKDAVPASTGAVPASTGAVPADAGMMGALPAPAPAAPAPAPAAPAPAPAAPAPAPAAPAPAPQEPLTYADLAEEAMVQATKSAKAAEKRIYDWMVESNYPAEMRKVIFDGARLGVGILKGPYPEMRISKAMSKDEATGELKLVIEKKIQPAVKWIDPWNFYPSPSCGENIHNGDWVWEVDYLSKHQVEELLHNPFYIKSQLVRVLTEAPEKRTAETEKQRILEAQNPEDLRYEIWYGHGTMSYDDLVECNPEAARRWEKRGVSSIPVIATMINSQVVRATPNTLESGEFPYHCMPWQRRANSWVGVGAAEQVRMPQRSVNAATRRMFENAAKSSGAQVVLDRGCIIPADGQWNLTPDKLWFKAGDATVDDVQKAFATFQFPNIQKEMMAIIEYAFRLAEEATSIPLISQGQSGKTTPDTFGGQQLQDNNANQLLRAIGYTVDDNVTEPVVRQFYEWLLLDPEVPDDEKGDWNINAHGSSAMVERSIQNQAIVQMMNMVANPAFGIDPKMYAKEYIRSQRLDPRNFQFSAEKLKEIEAQPPTPAPVVQAAQIRAQAQTQAAQAREQGETARSKLDTDRDTQYNQSLAERDRIAAESEMQNLQLRREEMQMKLQIAQLEYMNREKITFEQLKAELAQTSMRETTRKELAAAEIQLAQQQAMFERTHDKLKHNEKLNVESVLPDSPSLIKDEMSTNLTP
jgi:hypothetical protein